MNSPIDKLPISITAYLCVICKTRHRKTGKLFYELYKQSAKAYGFNPIPPAKG